MEDKLNSFQLEEYKNISNAHFETNKQIGIFFRYFLLIASAPALIFVWFGKENSFLDDILVGIDTNKNLFVGFFLIILSIIGILSCFYLISLRLDSILYARTINGIRKYFYKEDVKFEEQYRLLPKNMNQPKYADFHTFGIIVYSTALINSIYFALGTRIIASVGYKIFVSYFGLGILIHNYNVWWSTGCFIAVFFFHIAYYRFISNYRNNNYMRNNIIGIDIDGVLNKHRDLFCKKHNENMVKKYGSIDKVPISKILNPDEITKIPVKNIIGGKDISSKDEYEVFNNPDYWVEQELIDTNANQIIKELKNSFGYKINIHSYRPWPQFEHSLSVKEVVREKWGRKSLKIITKEWLVKNNVPYNRLYIEKSSIDKSPRSYSIFGLLFGIPKSQFKNRFYYTKNKPYRYFIEDSPENTIKLASCCEYVFLIEQPYNLPVNFEQELPTNVIRVKDWNEIKIRIKDLG